MPPPRLSGQLQSIDFFQQRLQDALCFQPGNLACEAGVNTDAERDMAGAAPLDVEHVGLSPLSRVKIGEGDAAG